MSAPETVGFAHRTLAEIASHLPGATAVFRRHRLDFCCGGQVPLGEAAAAKGLDVAGLEAELDTMIARGSPGQGALDTEALIALIETRFHAGHRRDLPELLRLAKRVEAVHGAHPLAPRGIAALLQRLADELEAHMQKEEQVLFPLMRAGGHPMIGSPIGVMLREHGEAEESLRRLEGLTHGFGLPAEACPTWRALYVGARRLTEDLKEHIDLENNVLFSRFSG
ncbi:Iron-sulfur cluster repair protein YtfE [Rhodovastum atsumiense]|uniref:Iron-sulfur cluster repair di-iron protein n=1 Tax=Rhodovastum atsumiense TaxID=504468 RepID=A0A5M6IXN4_9PROT|nr:DUF542 domain-containing protein [Rhodovastum atsumiense]KAA5613104.1 iron-sulfur cluster repair di-iron protein [Rhodovastum atsumiense]CAH2600025.1 Iron-sulfur cluster repair protein YtfE [Rhodovastum atsumiense]